MRRKPRSSEIQSPKTSGRTDEHRHQALELGTEAGPERQSMCQRTRVTVRIMEPESQDHSKNQKYPEGQRKSLRARRGPEHKLETETES